MKLNCRSNAVTTSVVCLLPVAENGFKLTIASPVGSLISKQSSLSAALVPGLSAQHVKQLSFSVNQVIFSKPSKPVNQDLYKTSNRIWQDKLLYLYFYDASIGLMPLKNIAGIFERQITTKKSVRDLKDF